MKMIAAVCLALLPFTAHSAPTHFRKVEGIDDARIRRVAISPANSNVLAAASANTLYLSRDNGRRFRKTTVLKDEQVAHLVVDDASVVYLAGTRNCYRIKTDSTRIFSADGADTIHFIAKHNQTLYVATSAGLYQAEDALLHWRSVPGLKNRAVYSVEPFGDRLYIAADNGVYLLHPQTGTLLRLFAARADANGKGLIPRLVKVDPLTPSRIHLCTTKGLFRSTDGGTTWSKAHIPGADHLAINCLVYPPLVDSHFFIGTDAGLFKIPSAGAAQPLYEGLPSSDISWIDLTAAGKLYVATSLGLYTNKPHPPPLAAPTSLQAVLQNEPSIQQVQTAALRYNSVHPDKVRKWRRNLKFRALFPKISLDFDRTLGSSFTKDQHYFAEGPHDWGITVSWDMGNLIWNNYEDDLDNRSKLTTQLRMDILDEVNRLYFERIRLKRQIAATPDPEDQARNELRLYELTAALDGYTGGLMSEHLQPGG